MSDAFFLVDQDLTPLTHGAVYDAPEHLYGSFVWTREQTAQFIGRMPKRGYGLPVREVMPRDDYGITCRHGRFVVIPRDL